MVRCTLSAALLLGFFALLPRVASADAAEDLQAGKAALERGELDQALKLLQPAAQALPQSVEAQLALAECFLKLGRLDESLARYRVVKSLSPDHEAATRIIAALTGSSSSFESRMSQARALLRAGAYREAETLLSAVARSPIEPEQRQAALLLLIESRLWSNSKTSILTDALRIVEQSDDPAAVSQARVLAALWLAGRSKTHHDEAAALIEQAGELAEPGKSRAELAGVLLALNDDDGDPAQTSAKIASLLAQIPSGEFKQAVKHRVSGKLITAARKEIERGAFDEALAILWPMADNGPAPNEDALLQQLYLSGGWLLDDTADVNQRRQVSGALAVMGQADFQRRGSEAMLLGYWLAAQIHLQEGANKEDVVSLLLVAQQLPQFSRPPADRRSGEALSRADRIQRALLLQIGPRAAADQRGQVVDLVIGHVERYKAAGDWKTGLEQFITVEPADANAAAPLSVRFADPLENLPPGAPQQKLWLHFAQSLAQLGQQEFIKQAATLAQSANQAVQPNDVVALLLAARAALQYPTDGNPQAVANAIVERYTAAGRFDAARQASGYFHADLPGDAQQWALIKLLVREAESQESQSLAASHALGEQLPAPIQRALAEVAALLAQRPDQAARNRAIGLAEPLVNRYAGLERADLSEAVITAVTAGEATPLADWALWMRINLLERGAERAIVLADSRFDSGEEITLHELHQQELDLINQLVEQHPASPYFNHAINRVLHIASTYQNRQAFDTAARVVGDFADAHAELNLVERFRYRQIEIALAKAEYSFEESEEKSEPPAALSGDYSAAIDAIAAFLQESPTGQYAPAAEGALMSIARKYGHTGAWPVSRQVLDRFAAAVPDYRSPLHLRLMRAATFLGELDREYGLGLLQPLPPQTGQASANGEMLAGMMPAAGRPMSADKPAGESSADASETDALARRVDGIQSYGGAGGVAGGGFGDRLSGGRLGGVAANEEAFESRDLNQPSATALAMIRQSQQRGMQQIAMLEAAQQGQQQQAERPNADQQASQAIALPGGSVLSEAEMQRQDEAADLAYEILIEVIRGADPAEAALADEARSRVLWLFGFFEGRRRPDRAIVMLERFLADQPDDPAKPALRFQIISDRLAWAEIRHGQQRIDGAWLKQRSERFEQARADIEEFLEVFADDVHWSGRARMLTVESFTRQASLASSVSLVRAGGLLVQAADALLAISDAVPDHPQTAQAPQQLWSLAEQLRGWGQEDPAIYVLSQLPLRFPVDPLAAQAVLRIAELYAANLSNPVQAVEAYQEYLSLNGDNESIRSQIFQLGQQLADRQRYLEALHVYGAFVDSFPSDPRAADALNAIGHVHQANEVWTEAIAAYERILLEYPGASSSPQVKLAIAECRINLSEWRDARRLYEEFLAQHAGDGQAAMARTRLPILKSLDRYQTLLADDEVQRNKDDAQFQIARIVGEQLNNPLKASKEFGKVVSEYPGSDLADDAQLEIGRALLALGRDDEARLALLSVPRDYPNSPVADDALYLIGQSYEQQAQRLAGVTLETARKEAFARNQRGAYLEFNMDLAQEQQRQSDRRKQLKSEGKSRELQLDEAVNAFRSQGLVVGNLLNTARQAEIKTETESALQVANRQDRINEAFRAAVAVYMRAASEFPLGDQTDDSLLRIAQIFETHLKDRPAAMETYQRIVKLFPGTPAAEDAAWKVAQFHEQEGKFAAAVASYREFIRKFPAASRVADAQFALAEALEQLGQWSDAMDAYEIFRQKFGQHPKAQLATEQIAWIKAYRK